MSAYFLSDIHLKSINERNSHRLLRFLSSLEARADLSLFFIGDIFDLWVGSHAYFGQKFAPILLEVERLSTAGTRIVYFEGNHDLHLGSYWRDNLGAEVYSEPLCFDLFGKRVRIEHGDYIDPEDKAYLYYRRLIRQPFMEALANRVPGKFWDLVGSKASEISRSRSGPKREQGVEHIRKKIHRYAEAEAKQECFDLMITGHVHVRDDHSFMVEDRQVRSINLGSWFEEPAVFELSGDRASFTYLR